MDDRHDHHHHYHVGPTVASIAIRIAWIIAIGLIAIGIGLAIPGCALPGAAQIKLLDSAGVKTLVDEVANRLISPIPPADAHDPTAYLASGAALYALAEGRKWLRDRNGKKK